MSQDWQMLQSIRDEVRNGFLELSSRLDGTNNRLDETNNRLDEANHRLDQTNHRLDETNSRLTAFQGEVRQKLDGIGNYLQSINGSILNHEKRIYRLEQRTDNPGE